MKAIGEEILSGRLPMEISCVISSNPQAGGIEKARKLGIPDKDIVVIDPNNFRGGDGRIDQEGFGRAILRELLERGATVVNQNGWLPKTPPPVIDQYKDAIFNQHPGPKKGTRATHGGQVPLKL